MRPNDSAVNHMIVARDGIPRFCTRGWSEIETDYQVRAIVRLTMNPARRTFFLMRPLSPAMTVPSRQRPLAARATMAARSSYALLLLALAVAPLHAQIESGQVIDDSTGAVLVGSRVLLQHDTAATWETIETTRTDARGLFQFTSHPAGVYRVALLGEREPRYFGAPDTLAADSMQQREFALPIVRRSAASAYVASEVEHQAQSIAMPSFPAPPRGVRVSSSEIRTTFIVDADGTADVSSFHVISGASGQIEESIRQSLMAKRFRPATIGGIPVRQVVEETIHVETRVERIGGR